MNGLIFKEYGKAFFLLIFSISISFAFLGCVGRTNIGAFSFSQGQKAFQEGKYTSALSWYQRTVEEARAGGFRKGMLIAHRKIGDTYVRLGERSNALWHYHEALGISNSLRETSEEKEIEEKIATIDQRLQPPHLVLTATMVDSSWILRAGEQGTLTVEVSNDGAGEASEVLVFLKGDTPILDFADAKGRDIGIIKPGQSGTATFAFRIPYSVKTTTGTMVVVVTESRLPYHPPPHRFSVGTEAYPPVKLELRHSIDDGATGKSRGNKNAQIEAGETIELHVTGVNRGDGTGLEVKVCAETNVLGVELSQPCTELGDIRPGWPSKPGTIVFAVGGRYVPEGASFKELSLLFKITEKTGLFSQQKQASLHVFPPAPLAVLQGPQRPPRWPPGPRPLPLVSDVDRFIQGVPECTQPDQRKWGVVVGIENYLQENIPRVAFAEKDALIVGEYVRKLLCVPKGNLFLLRDERATRNQLGLYLEDSLPARVQEGDTVFFYFAGHGIARHGQPYLVPSDGHPRAPQKSGYAISSLFSALDRLKAAHIYIFLDSCYSGRTRSGEPLLPDLRDALLEVENPVLLSHKLVVLSAAAGNQVSSSFEEQGHGLFTYYLLKGLMEEVLGKRRVTVKALADYVRKQVREQAGRLFGLESPQEPQLDPPLPSERWGWVLREAQ